MTIVIAGLASALLALWSVLVLALDLQLSDARSQRAAETIAIAAADASRGLLPAIPCELAGALAKAFELELAECLVSGEVAIIRVDVVSFGIVIPHRIRAGVDS